MNDLQLGPLIESWIKDTDSPPSDVGRSTAQIESFLPLMRQRSRWWPLPSLQRLPAPVAGRSPAGGFSMFSAVKSIVAVAIVALFGSFLLAGILITSQDSEVLPAAATESPSPTTPEEPLFPTGTFKAEEDGLTLEFRADGTCQRAGVPCTYGVIGNLYSEMTFDEASGAQAPATYYWDFDGERLTFEPWGTDQRPSRQEVYADHTFRLTEAGEPLVGAIGSGFPTGMLVESDSMYVPRLIFRKDGTYEVVGKTDGSVGDYAVNGNLYTEMTGNWDGPAAEVPATYRWDWDGERLIFSPWGVDEHGYRKSIYTSHVYVMDEGSGVLGDKRRLLLSHPQLDIWVTVEITERDDGRYVANAAIDEDPLGEGVGDTLQEAVKAALEPLGEPYASDMAETVKG